MNQDEEKIRVSKEKRERYGHRQDDAVMKGTPGGREDMSSGQKGGVLTGIKGGGEKSFSYLPSLSESGSNRNGQSGDEQNEGL